MVAATPAGWALSAPATWLAASAFVPVN